MSQNFTEKFGMTFAKKWSYGVPEFAEMEVNQHFGKTLATHVAPPVTKRTPTHRAGEGKKFGMTFANKWSYGVPEFAEMEVNQHFGKTLATHVAPPVNQQNQLNQLITETTMVQTYIVAEALHRAGAGDWIIPVDIDLVRERIRGGWGALTWFSLWSCWRSKWPEAAGHRG